MAGIWDVRDSGPTLSQAAGQLRPELRTLPKAAQQHYINNLADQVTVRGRLRITGPKRILEPGPRLDQSTRRRRAAAIATRTVSHPMLTDRGF
ncbi:hypothetical protein OHR68_06455 [Spirillospora sp. NBC_00431]